MTRATLTIAAIAFLSSAAASESPPVTFESPCECSSAHGKGRWAVKNDPSTPPEQCERDSSSHASDIVGPSGRASDSNTPSARREQNWFSLRGAWSLLKVEADGDLQHWL